MVWIQCDDSGENNKTSHRVIFFDMQKETFAFMSDYEHTTPCYEKRQNDRFVYRGDMVQKKKLPVESDFW